MISKLKGAGRGRWPAWVRIAVYLAPLVAILLAVTQLVLTVVIR